MKLALKLISKLELKFNFNKSHLIFDLNATYFEFQKALDIIHNYKDRF